MNDFLTRLIEAYVSIASRMMYPGLVEYYLWEVIEGTRKFSYIWGPLTEEEMEILTLMRDEQQVWGAWNGKEWNVLPVATWREMARSRTFNDVIQGR